MQRFAVLMGAALAAMVLFGKITELESGDLWSSATWNNGTPEAGDDVTVSGNSTYDLDIGALNSLTFAGTTGATLSAAEGKTLSLAGGIAVQDAATFSLAAPVTLTDSQTWKLVTGSTLDMNAAITMEAGKTLTIGTSVDERGRINFNVSNPSFDAGLSLTYGMAYVYAAAAPFGTDGKGTVFVHRAAGDKKNVMSRMYLGGTTIKNAIQGDYVSNNEHDMFQALANTTNVIEGKLTTGDTAFIGVESGSLLTFRGGWANTKNLLRCKTSSGTIRLENTPWTIGGFYWGEVPNMEFAVAGTKISKPKGAGTAHYNVYMIDSGETHRLCVDNALSHAAGGGYLSDCYKGTLLLDGHDVWLGGVSIKSTSSSSAFESSTPATVYMDQYYSVASSIRLCSKFKGQASLSKTGQYPLYVGGDSAVVESPTSGDIEVTQGDLFLMSTSKWPNIGEARVVATNANARLHLLGKDNLPQAVTICLTNENGHAAKLAVSNGVMLAVKKIVVNGVEKGVGSYSAATDPDWIEGEGIIQIQRPPRETPVTTTWTGDAGTTSWKNDGNWDNGAPQTYDSVVLTADSTYDYEDDIRLDRITFAGEVPYALTGADGRFVTVTGGVEVTGAFCRTNAVPLALLNSQRWVAATDSRLALNAPIRSVANAGLTFGYGSGHPNASQGAFDLNVQNPDFTGNVNINACTVNVYTPTAPFGTEGKGLVNVSYYVNDADKVVYEARLNLYGTTIPNKLKTNFNNGSFSGTSIQKERSLVYSCKGTNVITGQVQQNGSFAPAALKGSTLIFRGGWSGDGNTILFRPKDGSRGDLVFDTIPWKTGGFGYDGNYENNYIFSVAGNGVGGSSTSDAYMSLQCHSMCRYVTTVDWALDGDERTEINRFWGTFDMQGHPSRIGGFGNTSSSTTITSDTPAVLYMKQGYFSGHKYPAFSGSITGGAGISKSGSYDMVLASDASKLTTTGLLEVTEGTLCLTNTARWAKGTDIRVVGTNTAANARQGNLKLCARGNLNSKAVLKVIGDGTVEIPSDVTVSVFKLLKGDDEASLVEMDPGDYSSGFVTGGGTLHVRGQGMQIFIR